MPAKKIFETNTLAKPSEHVEVTLINDIIKLSCFNK